MQFATDNPEAQIAMTVVPFKARETTSDGFTRLLQIIFPFFLLLMYIPLLYRTVYRMVEEKATRAKESMRMMGMSDWAYWLSWLYYYSVVNTILTTLAYAVLMINVF